MFKTNEKGDRQELADLEKASLSDAVDFDNVRSEEDFAMWLDASLETLISQFEEFETDNSVRKFFSRK